MTTRTPSRWPLAGRSLFLALSLLLLSPGARAQEEGDAAAPAPYELATLDCGELNSEAGLLPLRASHTAGDDRDLLCKVTVTLPKGQKGTPKAHTVTFSVSQGKKTSHQEVRDARVLSPGSRTILFVIPAERLPGENGKVRIRAELSRPAVKPGFKELTYDLASED